MSISTELSARDLVDEYFMENRTRLLEIGAFLDRLDRIDPAYSETDFRMKALKAAASMLSTGGAERVRDMQLVLSDPTDQPLPSLDRKSAVGAYNRWAQENQS
jgi:hypothetical protein